MDKVIEDSKSKLEPDKLTSQQPRFH